MARFQPGQSGNPAGRPRGALHRRTLEGGEMARQLLKDAEYREQLRARLIAGTLHPALEVHLYNLAYGRPAVAVDATVAGVRELPLRVMFGGRYRPTGELPEPLTVTLTDEATDED